MLHPPPPPIETHPVYFGYVLATVFIIGYTLATPKDPVNTDIEMIQSLYSWDT